MALSLQLLAATEIAEPGYRNSDRTWRPYRNDLTATTIWQAVAGSATERLAAILFTSARALRQEQFLHRNCAIKHAACGSIAAA